MDDYLTHEELGEYLADMIDKLERQRVFAGDLEGEFLLPMSDGSAYRVTVCRVDPPPQEG